MQESSFSTESNFAEGGSQIDKANFDSDSKTFSGSDDKHESCKLYHAIENNDTFLALRMLDERSVSCEYVNPTNTSKWTMLHWAAYHGNETVSIIPFH